MRRSVFLIFKNAQMKKTRQSTLIITLIFCLLIQKTSFAQSMLKEISLKNQIDNSSLVVEGEVVSKKSFWDVKRHNIYTVNTIDVLKVFKGEFVERIEVVTMGGTVGSEALIVTPSLRLQEGDMGVFTLKNNNISLNEKNEIENKKYKPYASLQSFHKYNVYNKSLVSSFSKKKKEKSIFYDEIISHTKSNYILVSKNLKEGQTNKVFLPPVNIIFNLTTASAGTKTVLTINGSSFGGTKGRVGFSNADDGGSTFIFALDTQVLTWSDTVITVEIPSEAGTGPILVEDSGASSAQSNSSLTITYAELNAIFDPDDQTGSGGSNGPLGFYAYPTRHFDHKQDGDGGYIWEMQTAFFNDTEFPGAKAAFEKVLDQWRCETKVNWITSNFATTVDVVALDGVNIVKFDNNNIPSDNLDPGVLGVCFNRFSGCGFTDNPATWSAFAAEMDIVFDSEINWYFGNGLPDELGKYDFESVALHELGHAHQLAHTIDLTFNGNNQDDVMHFNLAPAEQQRVFLVENVEAGNNVQARSISSSGVVTGCLRALMTDSSICNLSVDEDELENAITLFPNPVKEQLFIKSAASINLEKVVVYDMSGRLINEYDISNASRINTISVLGMSKGVYFVNIFSDRAMITRKMVLN